MSLTSIYRLIIIFTYFTNSIAVLQNDDIKNYLSVRTPYRFIFNADETEIQYPGCKDIKIWMIIRHGTRLPKKKDILEMKHQLQNLKYEILLKHQRGHGSLNSEQLERLKDWSCTLNEDEDVILTHEGEDEMLLLAERMQKRLPNTIKDKYDNVTFLFRYTATQRAQQSARYFANGLFDRKGSHDVIFAPATKVDHVLRFYKHCDKWQEQVKKNPETLKQQKLFGESKEMNDTLELIAQRLGLKNVSLDIGDMMYKTCGYETAWHNNKISPWCSAFTKNTIKMFEYYTDLKYYWQDGYGFDLSYRQACLSVKNMFKNFRDENGPFATFLFSHSGTLLKILSHIQLYKPESHLMWNSMSDNRKWKTSKIDSFASNLAFVLFRCQDGDKVLTLHQEKAVKLPMCEHDLCPLKRLVEYFHDSIFDCDYSDICSLSKKKVD